MSSRRSRSGGTEIGTTFSRKYRSSRNRPALISAGRSLLVAASDARVHPDARRSADGLHHLLLQHAQHLGLRLQAHVADLVEEDRAAVRQLELAAPICHGAGERAAHVPEELALDQLLGNGRAVDLDERPGAAKAQRVDVARHQLLAGSVLAEDQHASVRRRGHGHLLAQAHHPPGSPPPSCAARRRGRAGRGFPLPDAAAAARCERPARSSRATAASRRSRTRPS